MKMKRAIAMLAAVATLTGALSACGGKDDVTSAGVTKDIPEGYPIETQETIRWWTSQAPPENDQFTKYLEEATGVKIQWEYPADSGDATTAFNLMIAGDDLPDIIQYGWGNTGGGGDYNIDEGILEDLTPWIEQGVAKNFGAYIDEHEDLKKRMTSQTGRYFYFPQLLGDERLASFRTWFIREDLLQKAGMEKPETLEEWDKVLRKFKEMGVETPLMTTFAGWQHGDDKPFYACFDIIPGFYQVDGKVTYGYTDPKYREWVEQMATWYKDGILDKEFLDTSSEHWSAEAINGRNGAFFGSIGGQCGTYTDAIDPSTGIKYVPVAPPASKKGEIAMASSKESLVKMVGAAVSATSKNKELAIRVLDYGYSEEGQRLWNFGKEGVSYEMKEAADGRVIPTYTGLILDPAQRGDFTQSEAMGMHTRVGMPISVQSYYYLIQNYKHQAQKDAIELACRSNTMKYALPSGMLTNDETKEVTDIKTPMETYREETINKIIAGKLPLSEMDNYYKTMEEMGVDRLIEIYQTAYDRWLKK